MALMGPSGLRQLFETILAKTQYAIRTLGAQSSITVPRFKGPHYQDFVVSLEGGNGSVRRLQERMLARGIHCGKDLSGCFPELGESLLLGVTEANSQEAIDRLGLAFGQLTGAS